MTVFTGRESPHGFWAQEKRATCPRNILKTPDVWTGDAINKDPIYLERQSVGSSSQMCSGWQTKVPLFVEYLFYFLLKKMSNKFLTGILNKKTVFFLFHSSKYDPVMQHTWPFLTLKNNEPWIEKYVENIFRGKPVGSNTAIRNSRIAQKIFHLPTQALWEIVLGKMLHIAMQLFLLGDEIE